MSLNIKNAETHKLALLLAEETGQTVTAAVTEALRAHLEAVRRRRKSATMLADIRAISAKSAALLKGPPIDHAEMLYDENGLPK
jgi:antitoxin VapB